MEGITSLTSIFTANNIIKGLSIIGGFLGIWSFIDNYLIRFKPKIFVGTKVVSETIEEKNKIVLNSIICNFEIANHRKKYGIINDFAVRVYRNDQINPKKVIYYSSEFIEKIPQKIQNIDHQERVIFSPINILPNSSKSITLVLSDQLLNSELDFYQGNTYYLEFYYQLTPKSKWKFIDKLYIYNKRDEIIPKNEKYTLFTAINYDKSRESIGKYLINSSASLYESAAKRHIINLFKKYKLAYILKPLNILRDFIIFIPHYISIIANKLINKFIKIPLIRAYAQNNYALKIKFGSPELRPKTEKDFKIIKQRLNEIISKINLKLESENLIELKETSEDKCLIYRNRKTLELFMSGDTSIEVKGAGLNYRLNLKQGIWNKNLWFLENQGFIQLDSFSLKIIDYLVLHS